MRTSLPTLLVFTACASTPRAPATPPPPPPVERSSLQVLLAHADELGLSEQQCARLRELEDAREQKTLELRDAKPPGGRGGGPPGGGMGGPPGGGMGGPRGGGMGGPPGGGMGGPPGGGMGGPPGGGRGPPPGGGLGREGFDARLDELDAQTWFLAEPVLTLAQRDQGAKLAMAWRERLLAWRAAMRGRE